MFSKVENSCDPDLVDQASIACERHGISPDVVDPHLCKELDSFTALVIDDQNSYFCEHLKRHSARNPPTAQMDDIQ
jgi:hypothetical protein